MVEMEGLYTLLYLKKYSLIVRQSYAWYFRQMELEVLQIQLAVLKKYENILWLQWSIIIWKSCELK